MAKSNNSSGPFLTTSGRSLRLVFILFILMFTSEVMTAVNAKESNPIRRNAIQSQKLRSKNPQDLDLDDDIQSDSKSSKSSLDDNDDMKDYYYEEDSDVKIIKKIPAAGNNGNDNPDDYDHDNHDRYDDQHGHEYDHDQKHPADLKRIDLASAQSIDLAPQSDKNRPPQRINLAPPPKSINLVPPQSINLRQKSVGDSSLVREKEEKVNFKKSLDLRSKTDERGAQGINYAEQQHQKPSPVVPIPLESLLRSQVQLDSRNRLFKDSVDAKAIKALADEVAEAILADADQLYGLLVPEDDHQPDFSHWDVNNKASPEQPSKAGPDVSLLDLSRRGTASLELQQSSYEYVICPSTLVGEFDY